MEYKVKVIMDLLDKPENSELKKRLLDQIDKYVTPYVVRRIMEIRK